MNITQSIIVMLFAHLITDYTLQGWLADGKQKSWWNKISNGNLPNKYRHDYIAAAPELYESLRECLRECLEVLDRLNKYYRGVDAKTYKTMAKARAAIEKSGGLK